MLRVPQDTSAEEPDGGNLHVRFRGGPGRVTGPGYSTSCQQGLRPQRGVERPVTQHAEQDVTTAPCERNEGFVMTVALTDLAAVIGSGDSVAQSGEGREEHCPLEVLFPRREGSSPRMEEPERRVTGASCAYAAYCSE